jgi:hypothetical protein
MAVNGLRDQDRLDGASNFVVWKARILSILDMDRIKHFALKMIAIPVTQLKMKSTRRQWPGQSASSLMVSRTMWCHILPRRRRQMRCGMP